MKKLLFILFSCAISTGYTQEPNNWDYPVTPGTQEWKNFTTHSQMVEACMIPDDVLKTISSEELIDLCLKYPLLMDIFAYNSLSDGFDSFYSSFNGIQELINRKNVVNYLLHSYEESLLQIESINNKSSKTKFDDIMKVSFIEMMLGCNQLQTKLTSEEQNNVLAALQSAYSTKYSCLKDLKYYGFSTNVFARACVLKSIQKENFDETSFGDLRNGIMKDAKTIEKFDKLSLQTVYNFNQKNNHNN